MPKRTRNHLYSRRGRYTVRVRVPKDLHDLGHYRGQEHVERSLGTADKLEAQKRSHSKIAEILAEFERARRGSLSPEELAHVADVHARRLYDELAEDPSLHPDVTRDLEYRMVLVGLERAVEGAAPSAVDRERAADLLRSLKLDVTDDAIATMHKAVSRESLRALVALGQGRELPPPRAGRSGRLEEASKRFLADREGDSVTSPKTVRSYRGTLKMLKAHFGDVALSDITRAKAAEFLQTMNGSAPATVNRHLTALLGLHKWAVRVGVLPVKAENPWSGHWRRVPSRRTTGWLPYTVEELNALVEKPQVRPNQHTLATARGWIVLVALYSGMRLGEVCALEGGDVKEENAVVFFDITAAKSEAGIRKVPVHSVLLGLGLLDYVKHVGNGTLWPGLKPGGPDNSQAFNMSKQFVRWRRSCGVDRRRVSFHSLRKNAVESLERARAHQSEVAQVVGHEGARGFTFGTYSPHGLGLPGLRDVVEKIQYPGFSISRI